MQLGKYFSFSTDLHNSNDPNESSLGKLLKGVDYFESTIDSSIDTNRQSYDLSRFSSEML